MSALYVAFTNTTRLILRYAFSKLNRLSPHLHRQCGICLQSSSTIVCAYCFHIVESFEEVNIQSPNLVEEPSILKHLETPQYDYLYAIGPYCWPIDSLVHDMKFRHKHYAAKALASLFHHHVLKKLPKHALPDLLVPIPLSNQRHIQRGYNQSQLLCDELSRYCEVPNEPILIRSRHTKAQSELTRDERIQNIADAFETSVKDEITHIAIVDDVLTTGATMNEACLALLASMPKLRISVWCMGLTLLEESPTQNG